MVMMLVRPTVVVVLQYTQILNHVHLTFKECHVNYTSIKEKSHGRLVLNKNNGSRCLQHAGMLYTPAHEGLTIVLLWAQYHTDSKGPCQDLNCRSWALESKSLTILLHCPSGWG